MMVFQATEEGRGGTKAPTPAKPQAAVVHMVVVFMRPGGGGGGRWDPRAEIGGGGGGGPVWSLFRERRGVRF